MQFSAAASSAIFDHDDRVYFSPRRGTLFGAVGLVSRGLLVEHFATGTLVDRCNVLTSKHVLPARRSVVGARLKFTAGYGTPEQASSSGTVVASGESVSPDLTSIQDDWLLFRLDHCLGDAFGFAALRRSGAVIMGNEFEHLASAGYPAGRDRRTGVSVDPACAVRASYSTVLLNDCAALPGNSGGPIFRITNGSPAILEVVAIQTRAVSYRTVVPFQKGIENQATPIWAILPHIKDIIVSGADGSASRPRRPVPLNARLDAVKAVDDPSQVVKDGEGGTDDHDRQHADR